METTTGGFSITRRTRRKWFKIVIDVALLVGFLGEFITREGPNYTIHS